MQITNFQRVIKLLANLCRHPYLLAPYLRYSVFNRRLPAEIGMPWWSFLAIYEADKTLTGKRVFEWGTGGSTIRYCALAAKWHAVEDNKLWLQYVMQLVDASRASFEHHGFDFNQPSKFEQSDYLKSVSKGKWDVIIIDGHDCSFNERVTCFLEAQKHAHNEFIIILDDYWRYASRIAKIQQAKKIKVFESVGPCRLGVTSTAFFYY